MDASHFQSMFFHGSYVAVPNLQQELSDYLECSKNSLKKAIRILHEHDGISATLSFRSLRLPGTYMDLQSFTEDSTPRFSNLKKGLYESEELANLAITLQTLMKYRMPGKSHWAEKFFTDRKASPGFLLLISSTSCHSRCGAVAYVFTKTSVDEQQRTLFCSYLDLGGDGSIPFPLDNGPVVLV